jgi:hypothetical protein
MATIGENVTGGTAGSVLFIDSNVQLAQDNNDFYYDPNSNTAEDQGPTHKRQLQFFSGHRRRHRGQQLVG